VQTTSRLCRRGVRGLAAKTLCGCVGRGHCCAVVGAGGRGAVPGRGALSWDGTGRRFVVSAAVGAVLAVIGAGVGAALRTTPASLTSLYLVILGVMPVLHNVKPTLAEKIDPSYSVINRAQGTEQRSQSRSCPPGWW
jgi:ABC-2 type transport system permease protein